MIYSTIFFDLDHTLWDFNTNCRKTLDELYIKHQFHLLDFSQDDFFNNYKKINDALWKDYNKGIITKEIIRKKRFEYTFNLLKKDTSKIPPQLEEEFLAICPTKGHIFPHTISILEYLKAKELQLCIITNGFKETQQIKLTTSGLSPYFTHVIESDTCGFMKPDKRIFEYALSKANVEPEKSIMIGDDLEADILGAKKCNIDQVFVNRHNLTHQENLSFEIDCLSKLKNII